MQRSRLVIGFIVAALPACGDNAHPAGSPDAPMPPIDATICVPSNARPVFESLTSGDLVIDATQMSNTTALTVALDRSILFTSIRETEPSPQYGAVVCVLQDADAVSMTPAGVRCRRALAGTDYSGSTGVIHVAWTVVTFTSGVTVQRGSANTGFTNPSTVALTSPADPATSFVLLGGMIANGTGWGNNEFVRATLVDAQTLDVRTNIAGSETSWQVVTMSGTSVERGTASLAATDTTAHVAINSLPQGGMILASYSTDNASSIAAADLMLQSSLTSSAAIDFKRGMAGGVALDVAWQAVKLPFFVRTFTTDLASGEATKAVTIASLPAASSVALASSQSVLGQSSGSTDYAGAALDLLGEAAVTLTVTDGGVTLDRLTSDSNASISWTVIDFAHDSCAAL